MSDSRHEVVLGVISRLAHETLVDCTSLLMKLVRVVACRLVGKKTSNFVNTQRNCIAIRANSCAAEFGLSNS